MSLFKNADLEDLIGGFDQKNNKELLEELNAVYEQLYFQLALDNQPPWERLQDLENEIRNLPFNFQKASQIFQQLLKEVDLPLDNNPGLVLEDKLNRDCMNSLKEMKHLFKQLENPKAVFEYKESILIQSVVKGSWLVVDNCQDIHPSLLERLNGLLEEHSDIILNEAVDKFSGEVKRIRKHNQHRIFLIFNNTRNGISKPLLNRCVSFASSFFACSKSKDHRRDVIGVYRKLLSVNLACKRLFGIHPDVIQSLTISNVLKEERDSEESRILSTLQYLTCGLVHQFSRFVLNQNMSQLWEFQKGSGGSILDLVFQKERGQIQDRLNAIIDILRDEVPDEDVPMAIQIVYRNFQKSFTLFQNQDQTSKWNTVLNTFLNLRGSNTQCELEMKECIQRQYIDGVNIEAEKDQIEVLFDCLTFDILKKTYHQNKTAQTNGTYIKHGSIFDVKKSCLSQLKEVLMFRCFSSELPQSLQHSELEYLGDPHLISKNAVVGLRASSVLYQLDVLIGRRQFSNVVV